MEKLEASQREAIKKMSSLRLSAKLLEAGLDETQIQAMDRSQMMNAWAEVVVAGKDKPTAVASPVAGLVGYDPELEKKRLDFEIRKYEEEKEERKKKEEKEEKEKEERKKKDEKEKEDAHELRLHEIKLKEKELQIQIDRDKTNQSLVNKTKLFADAMKGSISRMPVEVVHFLTYFKDVERLFKKFEVPDELKAHLLRPYLNEKAKILVSRMDPEKSNDYEEVKAMLLREFQLSPAVYQEKFNTDTRKSDETCLLYSARLSSILDAYLDSRKIDKSYEKLADLLVADRIKSTLPDGCLRHILAIESTKDSGWLSSHDLAEAVDLYFANRWRNNDRPKAGALGLPASTKMSVAGGLINHPSSTTQLKASGGSSGSHKGFSEKPAFQGEVTKRCFICGSKTHLKNDCPDRSKSGTSRSNAKVNTCQVQKQSNRETARTSDC